MYIIIHYTCNTWHKQVLGSRYNARGQMGYAFYFFISTSHTQLSPIYKGGPEDFFQDSFLLLDSNKNFSTYGFKKVGRDCPVVAKVSYRVLPLDFRASACSAHDTQSTQKSPLPRPDSPETVCQRECYSTHHSDIKSFIPIPSWGWRCPTHLGIGSSSIQPSKHRNQFVGGNVKWHGHFGNQFGGFLEGEMYPYSVTQQSHS